MSAGQALTRDHGADVLVLGCAGLAGYRGDLERVIDMPVVDPVQTAVAPAAGTVLAANL